MVGGTHLDKLGQTCAPVRENAARQLGARVLQVVLDDRSQIVFLRREDQRLFADRLELYDKRQSLLSALCAREPTGTDEISCATEYLHTLSMRR